MLQKEGIHRHPHCRVPPPPPSSVPSFPQAGKCRDPSTSLGIPSPPWASGFGLSHQALVLAEGEETRHSEESQSKGMRRKKGERPGRKETLPPWALPGTAAGTEGRLVADTNIGCQSWDTQPPTGIQREKKTGRW